MKVKEDLPDVGIIVGRFQVPDLHEAHKNLIQTVVDRHQKVIIFLGLSPIHDPKDPLDFECRKRMIQAEFPEITLAYINDMPSDKLWSERLDELIESLLTPRQTCVLYGGRDSFLSCYEGKYPTKELIQTHWVSGTELRALAKNTVKGSRDFRHGAIWAHNNRFPTVFTTVDIAVFKLDDPVMILLGKKNRDGGKWRFPGGFAEPTDETFEASATRELTEEVLDAEFAPISEKNYICSKNIDDWRYKGREDGIRTLFYYTYWRSGQIKAGDDLDEVKWFLFEKLDENLLVPNHKVLYNVLKNRKGQPIDWIGES